MNKTTQYDNPSVGCYVDESAGSADSCNERTIEFAQDYGFDMGEPMPDEENENRSDILTEVANSAIDFLNEQETRSFMHWMHDDNSLLLVADMDSAREDVEFVSSETQDYPDTDYRGEWLHVNCHGNATLYCRGDDGNDFEIWSLV